MDKDGDDNPGHTHSGYVPLNLCQESRAHMETKIDNMKRSIQWSVYLASAGMGLLIMIFQWYLVVNH